MTATLGSGSLVFEVDEGWPAAGDDWSFGEVAGVAVDSQDNVYLLTRVPEMVMVFDRAGRPVGRWGEGQFSTKPHGIHVSADGSVFCADDGNHVIKKFSPEGELLMTVGSEREAARKWSGQPFNRPTHVATSRRTGELFITDGYGNARIHRYTADGEHLLSWGEPGVDPGQFMRPHNIVVDEDDNLYIADRESLRVQVFSPDGEVEAVWNNIHRPCGISLDRGGDLYVGELGPFPGLEDCPGLGHRISIYDRGGQLLTRFGDPEEGDGPGQFVAPHGVAVDSHGDLYVAECPISFLGIRPSPGDLSRRFRSLQKFVRKRGGFATKAAPQT